MTPLRKYSPARFIHRPTSYRILAFSLIAFVISQMMLPMQQANASWGPIAVTTTNNIGQYTSLAVVNGNPAIAYYDATNGDLKFVRASDADGTTWGSPVSADFTGTVGLYTSMVIVNGNPAIAYYDSGGGNLKYVRATDTNGTAWAAPVTIESTGDVGQFTSMDIISDTPAIAYYDVSDTELHYVRANDPNGATWSTPVVVNTSGDVGQYASLAVVSGNPAIAYYDASGGGGGSDLEFVRSSTITGTLAANWSTPVSVDNSGNDGQFASLVVANGNPAIGYFDDSANEMQFARATNATGTAWGTPVVVDSTGTVGQYSSLTIINSNPALAYYDASNGDLKYARATDASGTTWATPETVDNAANDVGQYASIQLVNSLVGISYYDATGSDLKYARLCPASTVVLNTNDSGCGSLRNAVADAAIGATITFSPSLAGQVITLTSGAIAFTKTLTIDGSAASGVRISGNNASRIFNQTAANTLTVTQLILSNGSAGTGNTGGAINTAGNLVLGNTSLMTNTSGSHGGGAYATGTAQVNGGLFQNNQCTASTCNGGGLYANATLALTNTTFFSNTGRNDGGGLYVVGIANVASAQFLTNTVIGFSGGGAHFQTSATVTNSIFTANVATVHGGGAYFLASGATIVNSTFTRNATGQEGGGAWFYLGSTNNITNTSFVGNRAASGGAVAFYSPARVVNSLFAQNRASTTAAAVYVNDAAANPVRIIHATIVSPTLPTGAAAAIHVTAGTVQITNTIVASHTTGIQRAGGTVTQNYTLFFGNTANTAGTVGGGANSLTGDPKFASPSTGDYHLTAGSAAINAGVNAGVATDFEGDARPLVGGFEIGYDETPADAAITGLSAQNSSPTRLTDVTSFTATITGGTNVSYAWDFGDGNTGSGANASHTYASTGFYTAVVTATNTAGSVSASTPVTITNSAPVANAGADQSVNLNAPVSMTGTASTDPDNHTPLSYGWTQTGGPAVTLSDANTALASFTAPPTPAVLTFTLGVTDSAGLADPTPDEIIITVGDVAIAGLVAQNSSPTRLTDATALTATTTAGTSIVYIWNFGDGSSTASGANQTHTYTATGSYTAIVTATNSFGSASATTLVTITNLAPVANAGADQSVSVNSTVNLSGIASTDPDNHAPLTYGWAQTGGPAATLSNANSMNASFTAPATPAVLTFTLGVTDSTGLANPTPDSVVITVTDIPISGLMAQNSSPTILGNPTSLTASISSGSNVVYTWNFGDGSPLGSGATTNYTYPVAGSYTAIVTASNGLSSTSASTAVSIGCAPGLVVLNTSDSGCGSLRQIVAGASANDTVTFSPSLAGQVIVLTSGQILINKNLTIDAAAAPAVRVTSNYNSRIFYTDGGTHLSLLNLTLQNGRNSGDGGAIIAFGALSLTNTSVYSSLVDNGNGGAIYGVGPLYISGGVFQNNRADLGSGGAIASNAAVLTATQVISNRSNLNGGGVLALAALSIQNSVVQSNTAGGSGGGVNAATTLLLTDTAVSGNTANGAGGGGGLRVNGAAVFSGGVVQNNTSPNGMGGGLRSATVAMTNTQVLGNSAVDGGGLSYATNGRLVNVLLARNSASGNGEAVYANASGQILNTTIASPTLNTGAAIYVNVGTVGVTNTIVTSHSTGLQNNVGALSEGYNLFFGNGANLVGTITSNGGSVWPPCSDPRFVNPSADNYRLSNGSAAINAGTNAGVSSDFEGETRPIGSAADMGYDETSAADVAVCGLTATNSSPTRLDDTTLFTSTVISGSNVVFTWNFGDGSPTVSGATTNHVYTAAGSYTAIVTASNSAGSLSLAMPVTITNLAPVSAAGPDQTATVNASVTLSSTSYDPDNHTPLSFLWQQTGGPTVSIVNASGDLASFTAPPTPAVLTFTLRVTDSKGLADATPDETVITVTDVPIAGLNAINNSPTQLGSATSLTASVSAGTNVSYAWSFGDGSPVVAGSSVTHTYAVVGSYTATVTATNSVGVTNTTTVVVIVDVPISGLSAANSSPTRLTDATSFTASISAGTNVVYAWNFGDGSAIASGATATHVYTAASSFTAVVTATNGAGSASASTLVTITNLAPLANAGNDQTVSIVGNVNLIGVASADPDNHTPLSYLWQQTGGPAATLSNPGAASPTFTAPNTASVLTFTLRVTDSQGLGSVLADEVVINVIDIGISGLSANNSSPTRLTDVTYFTASVTLGTGITYTWHFGDGAPIATGVNVSHVYTAAGNYAVVLTATNTNGSVNASTVATIVNLAPVADAGSDGQGFAGMVLALNGSASSDPDDHTPLSYLWTQTGGPTVTLSSPSAISPSFTAPGAPAVLTFTLSVTDAQGAADLTPDDVVVTVLDVPIAGLIAQNSSPTTLGQPTMLTASVSAGTNVIYTWDLGDSSPVVTGAMVSHVYTSAGVFTATVAAANGSGGAFASTLVTVVNAPPVAHAGADGSGLIGSVISLDGSASSDPDGHTPLSYAWTQTGGAAVTVSNAHSATPSFTAPNAADVLTFSLTVTDARGLADPTPDDMVVTVLDVPIAGLIAQNNSPTTLGQATSLTANVSAGTAVVYTWNFGDGSPNATGASVSHVYASAGSFVATVTASNTSGQATATTAVTVVNQAPVANAGADQTVSVSGTVQLSAGNSGDADGHTPLSYRWTQTGGPSVTLSNPADVSPSFVAPGVPSVLTFTLTVTDGRGLADATPDVVVIRVLDIGISGLSVTSDSPTTLGQTTRFTATATTGSNVVYTWDFGDGTELGMAPTRSDVSVLHTYAGPGTYPVVVTARNGQGTVTAQTTVIVTKKAGYVVFVPLVMK